MAQRDVVSENEISGAELHALARQKMPGVPDVVESSVAPPCSDEPQLLRSIVVIGGHRTGTIRVGEIIVLARHKHDFVEIDAIESGLVDPFDAVAKRRRWRRGAEPFVGVEVHDPIVVELGDDFALSPKLILQPEIALPFQPFDGK